MNLKETEWENADWIDLAQYREKRLVVLNTVMTFRV
jgi:hypothetical protein